MTVSPFLVLALLFASLPSCALSAPNQTPKQLHSQAISLAQAGSYEESLKYFRAAVRGAPENFNYLNDLGVTEMRVKDFTKAASRFLEAAYLTGGAYDVVLENLEELKAFLDPVEWQDIETDWWAERPTETSTPDQQRHKVRSLPVVSYDDMLDPKNETAAAFLLGDHPYVLTDAMNHWDLSAYETPSLVADFGSSRVDYYPQNMKEETVKPFFSQLESAIGNFENPDGTVYANVDASRRNTYIQWNVDYFDWEKLKDKGMDLPPMFTSDDDWINECFGEYDKKNKDNFLIKTHWRMVLIGQKGAGMFNHKDTLQSSSFQAQVKGRKRWHLCSNAESKNLYKAGDVDTFSPNYEKFPKALDLDCFDVVVHTGEMIYYPPNYWHQTRNLDDVTMSVSGTLVTKGNKAGISREFKRECDTNQRVRIFHPEEKLCAGLSKCYDIWERKSWAEDLAAHMEDVQAQRAIKPEL